MTYDFKLYTAAGGREQNEDIALALEQDGRYLFLVADGLGGHQGGELAAALTAEELRRHFLAQGEQFDLETAIFAANRRIVEQQQARRLPMKSTVAAAYIGAEETVLCHVGDSRLYLFGPEGLLSRSIDHSAAQLSVDLGEIAPEQIRGHRDRHILTRALGIAEGLHVEQHRVSNQSYEGLLLCSDGFWEYVSDPELAESFQASTGAGAWLADLRARHARRAAPDCDNHTVVAATREEEENKCIANTVWQKFQRRVGVALPAGRSSASVSRSTICPPGRS